MESKFTLLIQLNSVFLITILSLFLRRSLQLTALKYWAVAWLCQSFALISLRLAFDFDEFGSMLFTYYFLGEYIFGFLLISGCKTLESDFELSAKHEAAIVPFVAIAIILPLLSPEFNEVLPIHAIILVGFYVFSFVMLSRLEARTFGWKVMRVSLVLLAIQAVGYFAVSLAGSGFPLKSELLIYAPMVTMVLQTALGFGMVIILLEKVLRRAEDANVELEKTKRTLEELVHTDPLTAALTRHAFYGFVRQGNSEGATVAGCVGFFDIDGLKAINDCYGHAAGDSTIRMVVGSIRSLMRAEDLIYRWGGDEFFVIMVSMNDEMAELRMNRLENLLRGVTIDGIDQPIDIKVSWGFTNFDSIDRLEQAIAAADQNMFQRKRQRKERNSLDRIPNPDGDQVYELDLNM
ncbi:MAG: diguanylate cyclase [Acidobacteria bacterium]|nr:diguanylate cyclase [Acidobacteriota bacterium]